MQKFRATHTTRLLYSIRHLRAQRQRRFATDSLKARHISPEIIMSPDELSPQPLSAFFSPARARHIAAGDVIESFQLLPISRRQCPLSSGHYRRRQLTTGDADVAHCACDSLAHAEALGVRLILPMPSALSFIASFSAIAPTVPISSKRKQTRHATRLR